MNKERIELKKNGMGDLLALLNSSAIFDVSLVPVLADLLFKVEKEEYVPFVYQKESDLKNKYVGITKYENISMFGENYDIGELFNQKKGYDMINLGINLSENRAQEKRIYTGLYDIKRDYSKKLFTFEFILNMFGEVGIYYPVEVCKSNFNELGYVQDFVKYLFDLQFKNDGKKLNYEEMNDALDVFLKIKKEKVKTKELI